MEGGPPRFSQRFTCADLLGMHARYVLPFAYRAFTFYGGTFQNLLLERTSPYCVSHNPRSQATWFGLIRVRSPLLAESRLISTPSGTEMFHFPEYRPVYLWIQYTVTTFWWLGFPIRKSPVQSLFAANRSLSQLVTSFIASESQGIRRAPLITFLIVFYCVT